MKRKVQTILLNQDLSTTESDQEVDQLLGDASKAKKELGWTPKTPLNEIISEMITHDKSEAKKELFLKHKGFKHSAPIET